MSNCSYCGVYVKYTRRGLCKKHYVRQQKRDSLEPLNTLGMSDDEFLMFHGWTVVQRDTPHAEGPCWEWSGLRDSDGSGRVPSSRGRRVSRLAYTTWVGPIPEGQVVRHKCDNPPCVNPEHLEVGTIKDNSQDMVERGRCNPPRGEHNGQAKLTENDVREIRSLRSLGIPLDDLADKFNVSRGLISMISSRKRWDHIL